MDKKKQAPRAAIITWCYNSGKTNYGQILQCYAMQTVLNRLGYETKVARYRKRDRDEWIPLTGKPRLVVDLYELWYRLAKVEKNFDMRIGRFIWFIKKNIVLSKQCYTKKQMEKECEECEALVCGSDQIWNPDWFQEVYALNFGKASQKRIAYAPSGVLVENESSERVYRQIGKYIDRFDLVAVREKKSVGILKKYTKKEIWDVLDPTLLLTKEDWNQAAAGRVKGKPYIFCYCLGRLRAHKMILKRIMKKYGVDKVLFIVSGFYEKENELERGGGFYPVKNAGPAQFLALIRDARAVCTDSFHGMALSIIYQKQFLILRRASPNADFYGNFARQENLLEKVGIKENRYVRCVKDLEGLGQIAYENLRLESCREEAENLLKNALLS